MDLPELMQRFDDQLSHVWMVRTFLKHSDEAEEDEDVQQVYRTLYDFMHALGPALQAGDARWYFHLAGKKFGKLTQAVELFLEVQPEVSAHMNFQMAARSLALAHRELKRLLEQAQEILAVKGQAQ